jgi:hypothetical protein
MLGREATVAQNPKNTSFRRTGTFLAISYKHRGFERGNFGRNLTSTIV